MKRRDFIALVAGAAVWPRGTHAQQRPSRPIVGWLVASTQPATQQWIAAFEERLHELGWIEGRNIALDYRWADGRPERMAEIAAEFVRLHVDVIVTGGTPAIIAAKRATTAIPIVFAAAGDPVGNMLVASLSRPGGNLTGLSTQHTDTATKRLELLLEILPRLRRLAIMTNVGSPDAVLETTEIGAAAIVLGMGIIPAKIRQPGATRPAVTAIKEAADALFVCTEPLTFTN